MDKTPTWYIVKLAAGHCQIVSSDFLDDMATEEQWGPFSSQADAIARRVGLIRAGKCQPT